MPTQNIHCPHSSPTFLCTLTSCELISLHSFIILSFPCFLSLHPSPTFFFYQVSLLMSSSSSGCPYISSLSCSFPPHNALLSFLLTHSVLINSPSIHPSIFPHLSASSSTSVPPSLGSVPVCPSACYKSLFSANVKPSLRSDSKKNAFYRWLF